MTANSEQKLAICHQGGVLLSAGAGSGKTFVLVQHILYLLSEFFDREKTRTKEDLKIELRYFLSSIVMMTFTKKAAGEMETRLKSEIYKLAKSDDRYHLALSEISYLTVTTIHGFCYKLIKQGVTPRLDRHNEIGSETRLTEIVTDLITNWALTEIRTDGPFKESAYFVGLMKKEISSAMSTVLFSPELKTAWKNKQTLPLTPTLDGFFNEYFAIKGYDKFFMGAPPDLLSYEEKGWAKYLIDFCNFAQKNPLNSLQAYESYLTYFEINKKMPSLSKGEILPTSILNFREQVTDFRGELRELKDDLYYYVENYNDFKKWSELFVSIFNFVENEYQKLSLISFADLEYEVNLALTDLQTRKRISKEYQYLIIDEFQDTSIIQFEIIKNIVENDFNRLLAVGDPKQAIYGFRGGEIAVFNQCASLIPQNLTLANNYRSSGNVINFNNDLFDKLFPLGLKFKNSDRFAVGAGPQRIPLLEREGVGELVELECKSDLSKGSSSMIDELESRGILELIKRIKQKYPGEKIAILYRNLGPLKFLVPELIREGHSFTAQMKIPLHEDPIISIFKVLAEYSLEKKEETVVKIERILSLYLKAMGIETLPNIKEAITQFFTEIKLFGLRVSFQKFLANLSIGNSFYPENESILDDLFIGSGGNLEEAHSRLKKIDRRYNAHFKVGAHSHEIEIMTAHSSKGLEFPHVILAGIHTNGRRPTNKGLVGKLPLSFRWKSKAFDKESYDSPVAIFENALDEYRDFSESKRLFYVACTRAKSSLSWCRLLKSTGAPFFWSENSWINGLVQFLDESEGNRYRRERIDVTLGDALKSSLPLFHQDSLGVVQRSIGEKLFLSGELSVTRLSTAIQCPLKFYLQNILRIDEGEIEEKKEERFLEEGGTSSASRGTLLHAIISDWINGKKEFGTLNPKDKSAVEFAISMVKKYEDATLCSERLFKFPLYGQMITGIIDLLVIPRSGPIEIWDFKSGMPSKEKEAPYLFQLKAYAKALLHEGLAKQESEVVLKILYLDAQEIVQQKMVLSEILNFLTASQEKFINLDQTNRDHCGHCSYNTICKS